MIDVLFEFAHSDIATTFAITLTITIILDKTITLKISR